MELKKVYKWILTDQNFWFVNCMGSAFLFLMIANNLRLGAAFLFFYYFIFYIRAFTKSLNDPKE